MAAPSYLAEGEGPRGAAGFAIVRNHSPGLHLGGSSGGQLDDPPLPLFHQGKLTHSPIAAHAALTGELVAVMQLLDARCRSMPAASRENGRPWLPPGADP